MDRFLDFKPLRAELAPLYSRIGRPSIDPELMIRMLLIGYLNGIRSETRLCDEVHLNLAYRWFCRLGLEGQVPERSTFSKNRHGRFAAGDVLRRVFETVVGVCADKGLVGGTGALVDGSTVHADANRDKRDTPDAIQAAWDERKRSPARFRPISTTWRLRQRIRQTARNTNRRNTSPRPIPKPPGR